jgi:hypothetical protein
VLLALYLMTSGSAARPLLEGSSGAVTMGGAAATGSAVVLEALAGRVPFGAGVLSRVAALCTLGAGAALRFSIVHAGRASATDREETLRDMAPSPDAPGWAPERVGVRR